MCAQLLQPLNNALSTKGNDQEIHWTDDMATAFLAVKEALASATLLPSQVGRVNMYHDRCIKRCRRSGVAAVHWRGLEAYRLLLEEVEAGGDPL